MEGLASMASMATFAATGTGHSLMGVKLFVSGENMKRDGEKSWENVGLGPSSARGLGPWNAAAGMEDFDAGRCFLEFGVPEGTG